ncbi:MAG: transposase family protein [Dehalococcoidales bacterium]|nr:transposase family protein [Dehalococcoidales bacterium]
MTRASIREYTEAVRKRYLKAERREKGRILDEFTLVTGHHRKAAIRLLRRNGSPRPARRRGRRPHYGHEVVEMLRKVWEASDRLCSKRLHPFLGELVRVMQQHGELAVNARMEAELCRMSPSTIDRLLRPWRRLGGRRPFSTTKPGTLLKSSIPIRTFADWEEGRPGFLEVDLVPHCGESTEGFYLTTLSTVDVASGWTECRGVWGKGQERVGAAIHRVRQRLPLPLLGLDSDNGSEFINQHLYTYCGHEGITFTRSRSYKKNDSCHVEQKNWSVVRRLVGYDRYSSHAALETLNRLYDLLRLYTNFFQPVMKLVGKTRHGAKVHKVYDTARTPYQRLLDAGVLTEAKRQELAASYRGLNPVSLLKQINETLESLWRLAERPAQPRKGRARPISVTATSESTMALR